MSGTILYHRFHYFPRLSNMFIIKLSKLHNITMQSYCGDPRLAIRNTRYAYNSRSHDQCVVNPHNRVDSRITSSIIVPNKILTIGLITKYDIVTQGKSTPKQRIPSSVDDPRHAYYPTGNWLGDVPSSHQRHHNHHHLPCSLLHSLTKLIARDKAVSTFELYSQTI
jgi:hypothetical protein